MTIQVVMLWSVVYRPSNFNFHHNVYNPPHQFENLYEFVINFVIILSISAPIDISSDNSPSFPDMLFFSNFEVSMVFVSWCHLSTPLISFMTFLRYEV